MSIRLKKLADQVMVITGASSGIGLTTARLAAKRGARLVLAARNEKALRQLVDEITLEGGEATYVVADVGKANEVATIAQKAIEKFGHFDTWVNDAGIGMYGNLLETATEDSRRLFDTNFWGVVFGSTEAAKHLRQRDGTYGGAIINIGSEVSDRAVPLLGMYAASKHAVKGYTDALRMELEKENAPISVTLVKPGATDTPFPQHAKNYMEVEPELPSPVYAPEVVAEVILHCAETPERDMFAAGSAKRNSVQGNLFPRFTDWFMETFMFDKQKSDRPARHGDGALYQPTNGLQQRSGTRNDAHEMSLYTQVARHPLLAGILLTTMSIGLMTLLGPKTSQRS